MSVRRLFEMSESGKVQRGRSERARPNAALMVRLTTRLRSAEDRHSLPMPREDGLPPGTLVMLILRVLASEPLHGYAIAQRIAQRSTDELSVEEGSLYPALQKLLLKGWVKAAP